MVRHHAPAIHPIITVEALDGRRRCTIVAGNKVGSTGRQYRRHERLIRERRS